MGFIDSATTVTVQAKLTDAGKKKLYESIENQSGIFITQFALGDSDANYVAIDEGSGSLQSGHVPEAGDFLSKPRSFAIYKGTYRPGTPIILHDGEPGPETNATISVGANGTHVATFAIETEWPKGETFSEGYWFELRNPTNISDERFQELFSVQFLENNVLELRYNGGANLSEVIQLVGSNSDGETDFHINITGKESRRFSRINIRVVN